MNTINICELSNIFSAHSTCNDTWKEIHQKRINKILENLPNGSGIDTGVKFDWIKSNKNKFIFHFEFHHLNGAGYYDGWTSHKLTIKPSFFTGYDLTISGKNKNQVKDYLYDTFENIFSFDPNYQLK